MLAALAMAAAVASSVTYDLDVKVKDEQGRVASSVTGTFTYVDGDSYKAHMCLKDELKDGRESKIWFEYLYADGTRAPSVKVGDTSGAGTESCHDPAITKPKAIDSITLVVDLTGMATTSRTLLDNPYVAPPPPVDADGDGFFASQDCNDGNPAIRPGAVEIRGNGIDDNCDGIDPSLERITAGVSSQWAVRGRRVRMARLRVKDLPAGAKVQLRCRGRRCPVRRKTVKPRGERANVARALGRKRRRFRARQTLQVRITAPGMIGKVVRYRLRRRRAPVGKVLCLPPGSRKPVRC
jgi:hypothetical protein